MCVFSLDDPRRWILASLPAAIVGAGIVGHYAGALTDSIPDIWQAGFLERAGFDWHRPGIIGALVRGASLWLPLLAASLFAARFWAEAFSRLRGRPLDRGWAVSAWLFSLMLPATFPLPYALIGISFGVVFGCHVFGGTRRQIVSPALLAMVFLATAYPTLLESTRWLPGVDVSSTWSAINRDPSTAEAGLDVSFIDLLLGREIGGIGTGSALACYAGALYLMLAHPMVRPMAAAAVVAASITAVVAASLPWHWHLVVGQFAFLTAFVASDRAVQARTLVGALAYGATFGVLTIVIRVADPEHPEASWFALLLAMLCVPMFDHLAALRRFRRTP